MQGRLTTSIRGVERRAFASNRAQATRTHVAAPTAQVRASASEQEATSSRDPASSLLLTKRQAGVAAIGMVLGQALMPSLPAHAIQGLTPGRVPGRSSTPDDQGFYTYTRPEGKSGGHGVGWSEIPRYSFKIPDGWDETPVSIADLGGTEQQGKISVVVAPILRFFDVGFNVNVNIKDLGTPETIIRGFAPELYGGPLDEDDIMEMDSRVSDSGLEYYFYKLNKGRLVAATAVKNRLFLLAITSNSRQYKRFEDQLITIRDSFSVDKEVVKPMA
eukprot:gene13930-19860_t